MRASGLVAGDAGVVDDDVDAAVALAHVRRRAAPAASAAVMSSCSAVAADPVRDRGERLARGRDVDADDRGAVAGERRGDRRADAAGRSGDHRDPAGERPAPSPRRAAPASRRPRRARPARHVGRPRREEEPQRRLGRALGPLLRPRRGCAVAPRPISLPTERAKPSSARCAVAAPTRVGTGSGGVPSTMHAAVARERADHRVEEVVERAQPRRCVSMPLASKTSAATRRPSPSGSHSPTTCAPIVAQHLSAAARRAARPRPRRAAPGPSTSGCPGS